MQSQTEPTRIPSALHVLAVVATAGVALWLVGHVLHVLLVAFAGLLLAAALSGAARWIADRTPVGYRLALAAICLLILGLSALATVLAAPAVGRQVDELREALPRAASSLVHDLERYGWGREMVERGRAAAEDVDRRRALSQAGTALGSAVGALGTVAIGLFIGLVVAIEPGAYRRGLLRLVPPGRRQRAGEVLDATAAALRRWVLGRMLEMTLVGVATWTGLSLLGVPLALTLALIAAVLTLIPNFGPVLSAIPAVLLGLLEGPTLALYVILLYAGIQAVESFVVTPLVERRTISLPPALTIVAQILLGSVAGAVGVFVASPLTAVALVIVEMIYVEDVLERANQPGPREPQPLDQGSSPGARVRSASSA